MKGSIYTSECCPVCRSKLAHSEDRDGFTCKMHPSEHPVVIPKKCAVKFGRDIFRRFQVYREARQFLEGLRYKTVEGSFDARDYKQANPMGFANQVDRYMARKEQTNPKHCRDNIRPAFKKAIKAWGNRSIKTIGFAEIDDFIFGLKLSNKTLHNYVSILHDFFNWVHEREGIPIPKMPKIKYELGWRKIVSIDTQQQILEEVRRISAHRSVKIWLGIRWLCTYIAFRPAELLSLKESQINVSGFFVVPSPKEKQPKLIAMLQEDVELFNSFPRALDSDLPFFRHDKPHGPTKAGDPYNRKMLYHWWKKACKNLGIEGVDLYGGCRHSSSTALSEHFSEQEIMASGTMHKTNKAARRYIQGQRNHSIMVYSKLQEMQKPPADVISIDEKRQEKKG